MDKAIDKGNLIDFFAVLVPGMIFVFLSVFMNLQIVNITVKEVTENGILALFLFFITSYLAGLLLMEFAVLLQKIFPSLFDYYRGAIKKDALRGVGVVCFEFLGMTFLFPCSRNITPGFKEQIKGKIRRKACEYNEKEFWILTHGYENLIERKKAYSMMNRSLAALPIAYIIMQAYFIHIAKIGTWPVLWKMILLAVGGGLLYTRARRQAMLIYNEVCMIYINVVKKYTKKDAPFVV